MRQRDIWALPLTRAHWGSIGNAQDIRKCVRTLSDKQRVTRSGHGWDADGMATHPLLRPSDA